MNKFTLIALMAVPLFLMPLMALLLWTETVETTAQEEAAVVQGQPLNPPVDKPADPAGKRAKEAVSTPQEEESPPQETRSPTPSMAPMIAPENFQPVPAPQRGDDQIGRELGDGSLELHFDELSNFDYIDYSQHTNFDPDSYELNHQIPEEILALDGREIALKGYMVPVDVQNGQVHSFIFSNSTQLCCFGIMPNLHEWAWVEMAQGKSTVWYDNAPIEVHGTLEVGEEMEQGVLISIYRIEADEVKTLMGY